MKLPTYKDIEKDFDDKYWYYTSEQILYDLEINRGFTKKQALNINSKLNKIRLEKRLKKQIEDNNKRDKDEKFIKEKVGVSVWAYYYYYCKGMLIITARRFAKYWLDKGKDMSYEQYEKASWEWGLEPLHKSLWEKNYY